MSHPLCLLADFIVKGIPFCCGEFSGLGFHYGRFWRAIFCPGIFGDLLKALGILGGLDFCLHLIILVVWSTPPGAILSNTLCSVSSNGRKTGVNLKRLDCALFL